MPRPRFSRAAALGLVLAGVATPLSAQRASDDLFRAYLTSPVGAAAVTLEPADEARAEEDGGAGTTTSTLAAWIEANGIYVVGGAAAIGTSLMVSHPSREPSAALATPTNRDPVLVPSVPKAPEPSPPPDVTPTVIVNPEPGTILLLATGLAALGLVARRRQGRA